MIVVLIAAFFALKNYAETQPAKADTLSVLLSAVGLTLLVFALGQLLVNLTIAIVALVLAIVSIALFVRRQRRLEDPLFHPC